LGLKGWWFRVWWYLVLWKDQEGWVELSEEPWLLARLHVGSNSDASAYLGTEGKHTAEFGGCIVGYHRVGVDI